MYQPTDTETQMIQ